MKQKKRNDRLLLKTIFATTNKVYIQVVLRMTSVQAFMVDAGHFGESGKMNKYYSKQANQNQRHNLHYHIMNC